jgi:SAM-dependent methyltransferase
MPLHRIRATAKETASRALERHLGDSGGVVGREELGYDDHEEVPFRASGWLTLPVALRGLDVGRGDVLADLGCGKGRVVLQAARMHRFDRVIGVERSPELARLARENVERLEARGRLRAGEVTIVQADIRDWDVPDDLTVAYIFNAFRGALFDEVVQALLDSYDRRPRPLRLVYVHPLEHDRLLATGRVRELAPPRLPLARLLGVDLADIRRYQLGSGRFARRAQPAQKPSTISASGSVSRTEQIRTSASSGPAFQTERTVSGATRTAVRAPTSTTSSPSLNCSAPETT